MVKTFSKCWEINGVRILSVTLRSAVKYCISTLLNELPLTMLEELDVCFFRFQYPWLGLIFFLVSRTCTWT
jgi:hypothetical protein